jgi:hypothetical protein
LHFINTEKKLIFYGLFLMAQINQMFPVTFDGVLDYIKEIGTTGYMIDQKMATELTLAVCDAGHNPRNIEVGGFVLNMPPDCDPIAGVGDNMWFPIATVTKGEQTSVLWKLVGMKAETKLQPSLTASSAKLDVESLFQ